MHFPGYYLRGEKRVLIHIILYDMMIIINYHYRIYAVCSVYIIINYTCFTFLLIILIYTEGKDWLNMAKHF